MGFGILVGCAVLTLAFGGATFAVLCLTARDEENFLRDRFGERYLAFAARVPAIIPRPASFFNSAARDILRRAFANKPARRTGLPRTSAFGGTARLPARRDHFSIDSDIVVNILRAIGKFFEEYLCSDVSSADIAKTFRYMR